MDTSKEYILMCEKAIEIQKDHKWIEGDFFLTYSNKYPFWGIEVDEKSLQMLFGKDTKFMNTLDIWLPRQDQLQEMVIKYGKDIKPEWFPCFLYVRDYTLKLAKKCEYITNFPFPNSLEQLWLAFVMKEKYNKVWDGKDWIKEK